jgi:transposase
MATQPMLLELPECDAPPSLRSKTAAPRLKEPNRDQFVIDSIDLDKLIPEDHLARGIAALVESLPTEGFLKENKSVEGHAGRPRLSPKMLLSIWVYSLSKGIGQATAIHAEMMHEPGLRWLAGNLIVSDRTISDFRTAHGEALRETFSGVLGILNQEGWIDLSELTLDGTKVKANAGSDSKRREKSLQEHIAKAAEVVKELEEKEASAEISKRQAAAIKRGAEEKHERLKKAARELEEIRKSKKNEAEREQARVSMTDPEARTMKDGHGGFALSYNVQVVTETKNKIVVNVAATQQASDQQQLEGVLERLQQEDLTPERIIVDGGYSTAGNIALAEEKGVELIGPVPDLEKQQARNCEQSLKRAGIAMEFGPSAFIQIEDGKALQCPAGQRMGLHCSNDEFDQYISQKSDCAGCPHQAQCSPKGQRTVKVRKPNEVVDAYVKRMREAENQERYKKRGPVAEFPHAWWKDKLGLRQFNVRGLAKVEIEVWWAALTYNIQQWVRLSWRTNLAVA